jgi:protein-disulfide isomerase
MCHYTKDFYEQIFPSIKERYVDSGKVKIVYKHFATEERSKIESEASLCANDQGKFWQFSSSIFGDVNNASGKNQTAYLNKYAEEAGMDMGVFSACMNTHAHDYDVERGYDEGMVLGIPGTPTFFINGYRIDGQMPFERFEEIFSEFI